LKYILLGAGGLLGTGFRAQLDHRDVDYLLVQPPWNLVSELPRVIRSDLARLMEGSAPVTLIWAAGIGHVGASANDLTSETAGIQALADALRDLPPSRSSAMTILFASSAGALFAGVEGVINEGTPPRPLASYGLEKLRQEDLLRNVAQETGARVVACRMSNLYGLTSGRLRPRGLIATAIRCARLRQPMTVFVSPDTRRDYLLNADAAALALRLGERAPGGFSTALVREGRTRTIAEIFSLVGAVTRRRVPVVYAQRPESLLQPRALRFAPPRPGEGIRLTPLETGIARMAMAPLAR